MSFSKARRLTEAEDFGRALKSRIIRREGHFVGHRITNAVSGPRLGLVVPKRLTGNNVVRNKVKRLAREAFRLSQDRIGNVDVVIRLHRAVHPSEFADLRVELRNLFLTIAE